VRCLAVVSIVLALSPAAAAAHAPAQTVVGQFFTETGGGGGCGYSVTDDGGVRFYSEFARFGGVQAVGYPASKRFTWDGFTVQVFQRVIFQWRADVGQAYFVNAFDRMGELGKNDLLLRTRQTPLPRPFPEDAGQPWERVVQNHLAVMDGHPAIKAKYNAVVGDPIQANGLPVSDVTDMGNHFALRAQRVVLQLWKQDVPWARAGEVTVALGGDIAKESGVLPDAEALKPSCPGATTPSPAVPPTTAPPASAPAGSRAGVAPTGTSCPAGYPIKGNKTTQNTGDWIYHAPGGQFYDRTIPEQCFASPEDAQAAGYRPSQR
jgi:hypothetical protein